MFDALKAGLLDIYPWLKASHLTFAFFWIEGVFMLPRFFVYHHGVAAGSAEDSAIFTPFQSTPLAFSSMAQA